MNRREFCLGTLAVTAGCSAGDNEMPQEYTLVQSPIKASGQNTHAFVTEYQEGLWTPTINSISPTYATQVGEFTKIGNVVHFKGYIVLSNAGSVVFSRIGGLPFTASGLVLNNVLCQMDFANLTTPIISIFGRVSGTEITPYILATASTQPTEITFADISNSTAFRISGTYYA